jgi:hypothetical protein
MQREREREREVEGTERERRDVALLLLNRSVTHTGDSAEARAEGRVGVGP